MVPLSRDNMQGRKQKWTTKRAEQYYGINRWGGGSFSIDAEGFLNVHPLGDSRQVRLTDIVKEAADMGLRPPMTIRVQDLLRKRVSDLNEAFLAAIDQEKYQGVYRGVFPIKVNQMREVVEEILDAGAPYRFGLEAGSKPELMIALAMSELDDNLVICNGYKDADYVRLALMGRRLGKDVILVVEQLSEVAVILQAAKELKIDPIIGLRIKLSVEGEGKWATSSGENAKFGLTSAEILMATEQLKAAGKSHCLRLVHFHIGSQVPSILPIKKAVIEASRYYCELKRMGFPVALLDVGGGLGVDYDGSRTNFDSSMNYSMQEYARDVVFNIRSVCDAAGVEHPDIISESGRALVAAHSILVVEVTDRIAKVMTPQQQPEMTSHQLLRDLLHILEQGARYSPLERYHDALAKKEEAASLFTLGYLDLPTRAQAETLFWQICRNIHEGIQRQEGYVPEELEDLGNQLGEQYVCNFSVFQSLLDHWALKQLFPIAPLARHQEEPTVEATLVDITCDSDGKISAFTDLEDIKTSLKLHVLKPNEPYQLGIFLVGAYQDIMGDLHNLFGRVNEVHVFLEDDEDDGFYIEESINGFSVEAVLNFIQYKAADLSRAMKKQIDTATRKDRIKPREGVRMLSFYNQLLAGKTYLDHHEATTHRRQPPS